MACKAAPKRHLTRRIKLFFRYLVGAERMTSKESYFPELPHKVKVRIFLEQCVHIFRYGELNQYYYLYGMDVKGANFKRNNLVAYKEFMDWRNLRNRPSSPFNYICILRDKRLFAILCEYYGIPCVRDLGMLDRETMTVSSFNDTVEELFHLLEREHDIFCKPINAECGEGIFCLGWRDGEYSINDSPATREAVQARVKATRGGYLVQSRLVQHPEMDVIYPKSINTIRIVTIRNEHTGEIELFHALLRIGAGGNVVDNWSQGGVCVGIDPDGRLVEEGYYKPPFGLRTTVHPDTGVVFREFRVPCYEQAVAMCRRFHSKLDVLSSIGWDVAITPNGPCLIEANDNWAISLHQVYGGLKDRYEELVK